MRRVKAPTGARCLITAYKTITGWTVARYETERTKYRRFIWQATKGNYCLQCSNENDLLLSIDELERMENVTKVREEI